MSAADILNKLYAFKTVDKYDAFQSIQPDIILTNEAYKIIVSDLLDSCCKQLISLFETTKKPTKLSLKQCITKCMSSIAKADIDSENRDFGYELSWFLAEKVGLNLKQSSGDKIWGYWKINEDEVIPVHPKRNKKKKD
jgi:hypothetical protein